MPVIQDQSHHPSRAGEKTRTEHAVQLPAEKEDGEQLFGGSVVGELARAA
jgi:hypothetical protein